MNELHAWLVEQIDGKRVEPNSALGEAINYMRNRWEQLTLFLRQGGTPLDNNLCERALKKCILHRKNSLSYRMQSGAMTGDLYMSLINTCELNHVSAFDYLNALQLHSGEMAEYPDHWMPLNYTANLAAPATVAGSAASPLQKEIARLPKAHPFSGEVSLICHAAIAPIP
jgi:transposase